ncbi:MAG: AAA family ATPase, partial [Candidatus Eremiobacteraeota bacterium]|nr:AAA family ATPase [Candidatus Eremiobacteraeota bacterium]
MRAINLPRAGVLERIIRANPRIVTIVTGPGWGKSFLGKELARALPGSTVVEFRNARSAEAANARLAEALAARPQPPSGFLILDDIDELAAVDPEGTVLDELLSAAEKHGRIALLSRNAIPLDLTRYAAPHEVLSLKRQDLELTAQESLSALSASNEPREVVERALELSGGWAVATLFFSRLAREGRLREAVEN